MFFQNLLGLFSADMAIDLGTANTLVHVKGKGIVLNEPSVVAVKDFNGKKEVWAVGAKAKQMLGRTPGDIRAIRPLRDGVIADFEAAEAMIKYFIEEVNHRGRLLSPTIIICVPSGATEVEERAIKESAVNAGAKRVWLIYEPMAAAIGAGLPSTTRPALWWLTLAAARPKLPCFRWAALSIRVPSGVGGDKMDSAIISYIRRNLNLLVGESSAERIKKEIGSACVPAKGDGKTMEIKGRDLVNGVPKEIVITERQIAESLAEPVMAIVEAVKIALENTAPELAADIVDKGIMMTGGGSILANLDTVIRNATGLPVSLAEDPLTCVVRGTGKALDNFEEFRGVLYE